MTDLLDRIANETHAMEHARAAALNTPIPGTIVARCLARGGTDTAADGHRPDHLDPDHLDLWTHTYKATLQGRARAALELEWLTAIRTDPAAPPLPHDVDHRAQVMAKLTPQSWIIATPNAGPFPWTDGWVTSNNATDYADHALAWAVGLHPHIHRHDSTGPSCQITTLQHGHPIGPVAHGERRCRDAIARTVRNILPRIYPWTI